MSTVTLVFWRPRRHGKTTISAPARWNLRVSLCLETTGIPVATGKFAGVQHLRLTPSCSVSLRPFYLPDELPQVFFHCCVYYSKSKFNKASETIFNLAQKHEQRSPDARKFFDFYCSVSHQQKYDFRPQCGLFTPRLKLQ